MKVLGPDSVTLRHLAEILEGLDAEGVVYVPSRSGPDLEEARPVFAAVPPTVLLVVISSAAVCDPDHHHPGMVTESRLPLPRNGNPLALAWRGLEEAAREAHPQRLTLLRPAAVAADPDDPLARLLHGRLALTLPGHDPTVQFLSLEDLGQAVVAAIQGGGEGIVHLAPAGNIPLRQALRRAGVRRLAVPRRLQRWFHKRPTDLEYRRYSWTVDSERGAALGFTPRDDSATAIAANHGARGSPEEYDAFGQDRAYIGTFGRTLFRFLHDLYWRVEVQGLEHVPRQGRFVLAGTHRGFMPWDGVMLLHLLVRELGRYPRFLIHPGLIKYPFLFNYMSKLGGIIACRENAARVLEADEPLGIFPEGIQGAFCRYRDAYRLGRFGRGEYIKMALRHGAPLVPVVTVGSAETFPVLAKIRWRWFEKTTEWPCLPVTPTLNLVPLPSKWHTRFLKPIPVAERYGPEAAEDPRVVRTLNTEVRRRMQEAMDALRRRRPSIFFGSAFAGEAS